jgi:hypothetical protein
MCIELNSSYFISYHLCKGIFKFAILNHKYYNKVFRYNYKYYNKEKCIIILNHITNIKTYLTFFWRPT